MALHCAKQCLFLGYVSLFWVTTSKYKYGLLSFKFELLRLRRYTNVLVSVSFRQLHKFWMRDILEPTTN